MAPLVSIIVTCFNQAHYLEKSVQSVLDQTFTDLECIIVDDGSTDNTRQVAEALVQLDPRVQYFYKENGGVSSTRNFGFSKAQGEWIQFLDGDDWIHVDKIRFQLSHTDAIATEAAVFYSDYERVFLDQDQNILERQVNTVGPLTREQLIERILIPDFLATSPFPLLQQCMLMQRTVLQKKLFDERLKALQDRDFPLDLLMLGVQFIYTPIIGAYYTKHKTNRTNNWSYMQNYYILFYEIAYSKHQDLHQFSQVGLEFLTDEALREKNKANFDRLTRLIQPPVYIFGHTRRIDSIALLKLAYWSRLIFPTSLLYKQYRGPRSQKVISMLSKIFQRQASPTRGFSE